MVKYEIVVEYYWFLNKKKLAKKIIVNILRENSKFDVKYMKDIDILNCDKNDENEDYKNNENNENVDNDEIKQLITFENNAHNFLEEWLLLKPNIYNEYLNKFVVWKEIQFIDNWHLYIFEYVYKLYTDSYGKF